MRNTPKHNGADDHAATYHYRSSPSHGDGWSPASAAVASAFRADR